MTMRTDSRKKHVFGGAAITLGLVTALAIAIALPDQLDAQVTSDGRYCTQRTLHGDYGLLVSGVRRLPPALGGGTEHFVATGVWTFDGLGTFVQQIGAAMHGEVTGIAVSTGDIAGSYTVKENCSGTMLLFVPDLPFPVQYSFAIVDNARQIKAIVMNPGVATAELTRK